MPQPTGDGAATTALEDAAAPAPTAAAPRDAATTRQGRLEFLDALRGIAALVVAVQHLGETQWVGLLGWSHHWFRLGEFGVLVFFLCSGFIIPASLERRNDLVEFWIGRFFRLWPLYLAVVAVALGAWALSDRIGAPEGYRVVEDSLLNTTMLQVFTTRPLVIGASWTLGYELVFYLLVSVLFLLGLHRASATTAVVLLVSALALGGTTTVFMVQRQPDHWWTFPVAGALLLLVAAARVPGLARQIALLGMGAVVVVALANRPHEMYFSLLLLGSMFVGTVLYRWTVGQLSGRTAAGVYGLGVLVIVLCQYTWHVGYLEPISGETPSWLTQTATFLGAYAVFGAALLLRRYRWPRPLVYLGTISYSVYLLHALVLLLVLPPVPGGPWANFAALLAITLVASALTYRFVERPGIALGRRVVAARRERLAARG
ncbi:acyltransferase [Blastococcus sp. TML/M2B]|uniref:acyltransferase family protein n=1 Tax=unclassified Blastococcus TaxID=2619396 RepID=UPI00190D308D|nr:MULTISPECIES: acyltransferase [unclassified Blastococcus]MBN1093812.1 acyltransferase [Blastococcus sp. TML/M2B]MBN1096064.1 acyltransferase [Blastococcus sp. TML/C7B]